MVQESVSYFGAGPAKLPKEVLKEIQDELIHYKDTKVSVMEISHRSADFAKIINESETLIREILKVPSNYKVLFLQGGGTGQFAAIPLNFIGKTGKASYFVTGTWSEKAAKECKKFGEVHMVLPSQEKYRGLPPQSSWSIDSESSYVYYCDNETVHGVEFKEIPEVPDNIPIICDMSSNFFTRPVDVSKYGMIFGGAQKNIGCAGVTLVIVREDLLGNCMKMCPSVLDYSAMTTNKSLLNTPPTFAVYVLGRVMNWVKDNGGVEGMEKNSKQKSELLYSVIDSSNKFYRCPVDAGYRSRTNLVFNIGGEVPNEKLEKLFVEEAAKEGLLALKGHRSIGGIRASLYNAITFKDVEKLVKFMKTFHEQN